MDDKLLEYIEIAGETAAREAIMQMIRDMQMEIAALNTRIYKLENENYRSATSDMSASTLYTHQLYTTSSNTWEKEHFGNITP